jgi:hypothetical protein
MTFNSVAGAKYEAKAKGSPHFVSQGFPPTGTTKWFESALPQTKLR